jgi:hypothetical protein
MKFCDFSYSLNQKLTSYRDNLVRFSNLEAQDKQFYSFQRIISIDGKVSIKYKCFTQIGYVQKLPKDNATIIFNRQKNLLLAV